MVKRAPNNEVRQHDEALISSHEDDQAVLQTSRRYTRRSFAIAAVAAAAGYGLYEAIMHSHQEGLQPWPMRKAFLTEDALSRAVFNDRAMAPTYPLSHAKILRVNGVVGLQHELVPESWRLQMTGVANAASHPQYVADVTAWNYRYKQTKVKEDPGHDEKVGPSSDTMKKMMPSASVMQKMTQSNAKQGSLAPKARPGTLMHGLETMGGSASSPPSGTPGLLLTMDDVTRLPKRELVTQFKCIEGWSQIVQWNGVRMADLIDAYPPAPKSDGTLPRYVYMQTPSGEYYVGYDLHSCLHPQTLLVTEMFGQPLTQYHGGPLRLHTPAKYGYKQIKRIGLIAYTDTKPDDYWAKVGYDWYAGL